MHKNYNQNFVVNIGRNDNAGETKWDFFVIRLTLEPQNNAPIGLSTCQKYYQKIYGQFFFFFSVSLYLSVYLFCEPKL